MKKWLVLCSMGLLAVALCSCGKEKKPESDMVMLESESEATEENSVEATEDSQEEVSEQASEDSEETTKEVSEVRTDVDLLTYVGHAAVKLQTLAGTVIYVDPAYALGDYSQPADIILITHDHSDHDVTSYCTQNDGCRIIKYDEALVDGEYKTFTVGDVTIEAVPAGNSNHDINKCVGYLITFDDITVYHAGDTSTLDTMSQLTEKGIDYALYPIDGTYNMDAVEATSVANLVGARVNIPIHEFDTGTTKKSDKFTPDGGLVLEYGVCIELSAE